MVVSTLHFSGMQRYQVDGYHFWGTRYLSSGCKRHSEEGGNRFLQNAGTYQIACYHNPKVYSLNIQANPTYLDSSVIAYTTSMITFIRDAYYKIHITSLCTWIHLEINRKSKIFTMYFTLHMFLQTVYKWTLKTVLTGLKIDGKISACQTHFSNMTFNWLIENKHFKCKILSHTIIVYERVRKVINKAKWRCGENRPKMKWNEVNCGEDVKGA
jgi:hypothetical protein